MMVVFGGILGVFNTLGTVLSEIGSAYKSYTTDDFSTFGALFIVGGVLGSVGFGVFLDVTKKFKSATLLICTTSLIAFGAFIAVIGLEEPVITTILCALIGASMVPILPVGFEFAIEMSYPVGEAMSAGVLMSVGQVIGIIFTLMTTALLSAYENPDGSQDKMGGLISMFIMLATVLISFIFSFFLREDLRRLKLD